MHVTVYSKPQCSFCTSAKMLLQNSKVPFVEKKLDIDFTRDFLVEQFPTARSYPVIVVDGFYIGGFQDLQQYLEEHTQNGDQQLLQE